jgi:WD40 repeat protein/serine/threonine protein kinase
MAASRSCQECGTALPENAPEGLCPKCLMRVALGESRGGATLDNSARIDGPGTVIGRYELLELIGEGGMGLVYLAEQKEPVRRKVALKIIKPGMDSQQVIARFEAERQALALLDHPNIAHVFDAGTTETGRPYFVMEHVPGRSITRYCDEKELTVEQRLRLFGQVCEAVQHAHQKGIIHRDLKPSNILICVHGDRAVPKIIDFGIAKAIAAPLGERTALTEQGQLLGTPEYMSPEQADLAYGRIDTRSDVYSLGVVLYELLAGVAPFAGHGLREGGIEQIRQIIRDEEPKKPSAQLTALGEKAQKVAAMRRTQILALARRLKSELEWIPLKAMRKEPDQRYQSVADLAQDISNYLAGTALLAGPESRIYRTRKFMRKHAGSVATVTLVTFSLIGGLIGTTMMYVKADTMRAHAVAAREKEANARVEAEQAESTAQELRRLAEEQTEKYRYQSYIYAVALADVKYREQNPRSALRLLDSCPEDLRNWEWHRLYRALHREVRTFNWPPYMLALALSPDGKRIATTGIDKSLGDGQHRVMVWDAVSGTRTATLEGYQEKLFLDVAFGPDGNRIAAGGIDKTVRMWDVQTGTEIMRLQGHEARVGCVRFSPDGTRVFSGSHDGTIKIWDAGSGELRTTVQAGGTVRSLALSPDGKRVLCGNFTDRVVEFDGSTGAEVRVFKDPAEQVAIATYSPDGKRIALGGVGGMIKIIDTATGAEIAAASGGGRLVDSMITSLAFSPDGSRVVAGSSDQAVKIWDATTGAELATLIGHKWKISTVAFTPDGRHVISAGYDGEVKKWDAGMTEPVLKGHEAPVRDIAFSPDGTKLISGGEDNTIRVWDVMQAREIGVRRGHAGPTVWAVALSPDGTRIASGNSDRTIKVWETATGQELLTLRGHSGPVVDVSFSPNGQRIASVGSNVKVWDIETGAELMTLPVRWGRAVTFSPDGTRIVSGDEQGIKVWDAATAEELKTLSKVGMVSSVVFTPDGKRVISAGYGGHMVRIWDAQTGEELATLHGHKNNVQALAVSPDGTRVVSGSFTVAKVWDAATGAELATLPAEGAYAVAFSPDGKTVAGANGREIVLWQSAPRSAAAVAGDRQAPRTTE